MGDTKQLKPNHHLLTHKNMKYMLTLRIIDIYFFQIKENNMLNTQDDKDK